MIATKRIVAGVASVVMLFAMLRTVSAGNEHTCSAGVDCSVEVRSAAFAERNGFSRILNRFGWLGLMAGLGFAAVGVSSDEESDAVNMLRNLTRWLSNQSTPIVISDSGGRVLDATKMATDLFAAEERVLQEGDKISTALQECCVDGGSLSEFSRLNDWLSGGALHEIEPLIVTMQSQRSWRIMLVPQFAGDDNPAFWLWMFQDASDTLRLEQHQAHTEKMETISRFAGGMAHEFNNLLTVILGNLELMRCRIDEPVRAVEARIAAAESAALRANLLIKELRRFASRDAVSRSPQCVLPIAERVCESLSAIKGGAVEVSHTFRPEQRDRLMANVNDEQLEEALLKLGENAIDAVGDVEGTVNFDLQIVTLSGTPLLQITIQDSGGMLDAATWDQAFEPFFTSATRNTSSGLSMAIADGLIKEMEGFVQVVDSNSSGTEIRVSFPLSTVATSEKSEVAPSRALSVAIVDERSSVRDVSRAMLKILGHHAECFTTGPEFLAALSGSRRFDTVLLTSTMGGQTTNSIYRAIREFDGSIRVILVSGQPLDLVTFSPKDRATPDATLTTPFSVGQLSQAMTVDETARG